ncbi:oxysterols receptor LXR-alpha isoform X2 [Siniperca chuatsi]|uniref:oxysterols receptor LXR-alpha isoform X2 n=1 Tax=Siniperca chuatsi TaxID=119488 RepID=UPI001CE0B598|nr:oxysterols receptor LXR-alpha isoform X2 [Siniperca chuatsi]
MSTLSVTDIPDVGHDESKVLDRASELQLDCLVEESSGSTTMKHEGLLSLADLSHPDDFPVLPHNGPSLTEMSSPLPIEPNDIKLDPAAGDTSASIGVLSEEQIRLKKMKKQHEEETARTSTVVTPTPPQEAAPLDPQQQEMIEKLVAMQKQCNKRSFLDRPKVTPWPQSQDLQNREVRQQRFAHFTELAIMSVQEIVDFAKQLPGFLELTREDQIALLKTSTIEIMLLETSRRYNPAIDSITFLKDFSYNKEDFAKAGLQFEFINPIFEFSKGMNDLHLDEAEYALLIAINIFSADRPNVQDHDLVERLQQPYVDALRSYIMIKRPNDHLMFPRMLMKLVSLRTLSSVHSEQVFALRLQDKKLPPLLSEIWDVNE